MKKHAKKQKDSHQDPRTWTKVHKPHKDKDREKPREERKRRLETRKQDIATGKDLGDRAAVDPESLCEDGERPMGTESPPQGWGVVHGDGGRPT